MKRITLFLAALSLSAAALASAPPFQKLNMCRPPACFASPGCCTGAQCDSWCGGTGFGVCSGGGTGGCCSCAG
jgi:predicted RNA-binding Zn ribbon-like protein